MDKRRSASVRTEEARPYKSVFAIELARGASYIASTISPLTRQSAVADVMDEFACIHGGELLPKFCKLLAESLELRGDTEGALVVRHFLKLTTAVLT